MSNDPASAEFCNGYTLAALDAYNFEMQDGKNTPPEAQKCWQRIFNDPDRRALLDAAKGTFLKGALIASKEDPSITTRSPFGLMSFSISTLCVAEAANPGKAIENLAKDYRQMASDVNAQKKK